MSESYENANGWNQWEKHVLITLERIEKNQDALKAEVSVIREEVNSLKTKAAIWGGIASFVITTIVQVITTAMK